MARKGQGRSGGFRLLIAYESRERAVFLIGFAKSNRDNIRPSELASYKDLARDLLSTSAAALEADVAAGKLLEMEYDEEQEESESD